MRITQIRQTGCRLKEKKNVKTTVPEQLRDKHEDVKYDIKNTKCGGGE